ncbi:uncharacterized protein Bfra_000865 [Botrytis fragariae]|uniref:Uncharacterized protein n=1 Tax=Botrytis fragariae TaxID=1964551 RepID=A0A8H6B3X1_9HELO|nr:uncharacterized protein Bfra_000865 [Botrytis fragariae]KAF5878698.1 hypothetical protein Bfra_000865 [Botrytis fragariae]
MPSIPLNIFSSAEEFKVHTKIYPLVPGFVSVAWYIEIPNLKSHVPEIRKSGDSTAIEATQSVKRRGQHILISEHGILLLSGVLCDRQKMILSTEEGSVLDMLDKDELVVSKEVGIVKGRQILYFRRTFERLHVSKEMNKDHTTYIDHVTLDLIDARCFELKQSPRRATHRQPSDFNKRKRTRSVDSYRSSRSNRSFYREYNEVPPVKQEKILSATPKSHKSTEQHISQAPVEQEHPTMQLNQENLSALSEGHNSQAGPRTHRSSRSTSGLERNHHNGVQIMKSTDGTSEVKAAPSKRSHSRTGRVIPLYTAESDPGLDPEFASQRSDMSSSNPGRRSLIAPSTSRSSDTSSLSRSGGKLNLNVTGRNFHVLDGSGRTHPAPSSDGDNETLLHIKITKPKKRSRTKHTAGMVV